MVYQLQFIPTAEKEWRKLGATVRKQFAKKLEERLVEPHIASARLFDLPGCYKIKLAKSGYRLVYQVIDDRIIVRIIAVGKRERRAVYKEAAKRV